MKTKSFLLMCLFIGIGLTQLSAQNGKDGTGSTTGYATANMDQPIYKDGIQVDWLKGTVNYHYLLHFKDGELVRAQSPIQGEMVSIYPPYEVFRLHEVDKNIISTTTYTWHFNLVGNMGSHYIGFITWNWATQENYYGIDVVDKMVFPGNKK